MSRPNLVTCLGAAACVVTVLFLSGCGSEDGPVTAETTKFRPAGEGDDSASAPAASADRTPAVAHDPAPPSTVVPREGSGPVRPKTPSVAATAPAGAAAMEVPEGDIAALSAFIDKLAEVAPQGETDQE